MEPVLNPATDLFNEGKYLDANPDVKEAYGGVAGSGWRHYVNFGFREGRKGVPEAVRKVVVEVLGAKTNVVMPPKHLVARAHGVPDASAFDHIGRVIALDIFSAVTPHISLDRPYKILDFGCGCGRVTRFLRLIFPNASIHGTDIDTEAIEWCRHNCSGMDFSTNNDRPPLPFETNSFDFVCAISVFTHLPEEMQFQWLDELRRITRKTGHLILTFAGDHLIRPHLSKESIDALDRSGFFHHAYKRTEGLPDYYQATWHSTGYVKRVWSRYFKILEIISAGINGHQDLVLCQPLNRK